MSDGRIRVFISDDHAVVREGLRMILAATADVTVVGEAADGVSALRGIQSCDPDVALLDLMMPAMNGGELAEEIAERCPRTRMVILSMYATSEQVAHALRVGVRGYLLKENAGRDVVEAVRAVAAGKLYLSEHVADVASSCMLSGAPPDPMALLSIREREVLKLVAEGHSSTEIARLLCLSPKSVDTYRSRLMRKLGLGNVADVVRFAMRVGVVTAE